MMKIVPCSGEGASACKRCTDNGKWNITWTCFLYKAVKMRYKTYCISLVLQLRSDPRSAGVCFEIQEGG